LQSQFIGALGPLLHMYTYAKNVIVHVQCNAISAAAVSRDKRFIVTVDARVNDDISHQQLQVRLLPLLSVHSLTRHTDASMHTLRMATLY